jgi:hypothetical protein
MNLNSTEEYWINTFYVVGNNDMPPLLRLITLLINVYNNRVILYNYEYNQQDATTVAAGWGHG